MIEALASQNPARGGMFIETSSRPNIFFLFFSGAAAPARFIPMDAGAYDLANKTAPLKNKKKELSSGFVPSINMPPLAGF